ncbi:kininogen-1 [Eublepharis macularius]|uniref:Kininogen-1 n=1 Tax=Eublepharis macularius TaxID=481883 RepID=A0AA97JLR4_EUBMA|nr:kininogen-1 [Eublepharis macularius]
MEFFILLVLSFYSCQATPLPTQEVDCNDPKVFKAVDLALQKFNGERTQGNQFALVVVTEARRTAGPRTSFFADVKYKLRETICAVGGGIPWQNCKFKDLLEAGSGECDAHIYIDDLLNFSNVSQDCRIIPAEGKVTASHASCTGCWTPIANNSLDILPFVRHTIRQFNNQNNHPALFEVLEIIQAHRQVVAGWNYAYEYLIKETNCSRDEFPDLTPACKRIPEAREGRCKALVHINISNHLQFAVQECELEAPRSCPGCPEPLATDSPELEKPLRAALEKYNAESNDAAYYKVEGILAATSQVVAGIKYKIIFIVVKTNCSKDDNLQKPNEDCSPEDGKRLKCIASIYVIPWESKIFPNVTCEQEQHRTIATFAAWPPGMTPFRSFQSLPPEESKQTTGKQKSHFRGSRRGMGIGPLSASGHKQEQTKENSSEESHEGVKKQEETSREPVARILEDQPSTAKSCLQEEVPNKDGAGLPAPFPQQDNARESSDFSVSDLLPEPDIPKCPGKPWKPITVLPTTPPEIVFCPGADGDHHEATSPPNTNDFNLADALLPLLNIGDGAQ